MPTDPTKPAARPEPEPAFLRPDGTRLDSSDMPPALAASLKRTTSSAVGAALIQCAAFLEARAEEAGMACEKHSAMCEGDGCPVAPVLFGMATANDLDANMLRAQARSVMTAGGLTPAEQVRITELAEQHAARTAEPPNPDLAIRAAGAAIDAAQGNAPPKGTTRH